MAIDLKPGDLVRDTRVWTVERVHGDSAHLSLDGHNRLAGIHYLEPVSAAPASEPEMQDKDVGNTDALRDRYTLGEFINDILGRPPNDGYQVADALIPIIARHLAERDARITELEGECCLALDRVTALHELLRDCGAEVRKAEDRASAAEAALAEERENTPEARARRFAGDPMKGVTLQAVNPWADVADRSRTITAEGADTGSAEHG